MDPGEYVIAVLFNLTRTFAAVCRSFGRTVDQLGITANVNIWLISIIKRTKTLVAGTQILSHI